MRCVSVRYRASLRSSTPTLLILLLVLSLIIFPACSKAGEPDTSTNVIRMQGNGQVPGFSLIDQDGNPVTSEALKGRAVVYNFIYTSCPTACPFMTASLAEVRDLLARKGLLKEVLLVSISFDPERDTPEVLKQHARRFNADTEHWRWLTGSGLMEDIERVVHEGFGVKFEKITANIENVHSGGGSGGSGGSEENNHLHGGGSPEAGHQDSQKEHEGYRMGHTNKFVIADGTGRIRWEYFGMLLEPETVLKDLRRVLK